MAANSRARYKLRWTPAITTNTAKPAEISSPGMITGLRPTRSDISPRIGPKIIPRADVERHVYAHPESWLVGPVLQILRCPVVQGIEPQPSQKQHRPRWP